MFVCVYDCLLIIECARKARKEKLFVITLKSLEGLIFTETAKQNAQGKPLVMTLKSSEGLIFTEISAIITISCQNIIDIPYLSTNLFDGTVSHSQY